MYTERDFIVENYNSREDLRRIVVYKFLDEEPGSGRGDDASRYRYNVETLSDGRRIYLTRPAILKKGFDFRISVEHTTFKTGKDYPKHDDIFDDLKQKKVENANLYRRLHQAMERVFNCEEPSKFLHEYSDIVFHSGHPIELILKVIKWFFIEQDIRDWNYSGRQMFMNRLRAIAKDC